MNVKKSFGEMVGRTPLLELVHIEKKYDLKAKLYAKLDYFNPGGSAKDRVAKQIIESAMEKGELNGNSVIIEPTSGNTGIGLAAIAASLHIRTIITMPENMSMERIKLMKIYGAEVILTPAELGMAGAIEKAEELAREIYGSFIPGQFVNPMNPKAHELTTGPEIWEDTDGTVDVFVAGVGTGGTITGTGRYLKSKNTDIQLVAVEPKTSPVLTNGTAGSHKIQGIGANFVPDTLDRRILDEIMLAGNEESIMMAKEMPKEEGILVGISAGAALWAGVELAKRSENEGKTIVVFMTDTGERYMSSELFD